MVEFFRKFENRAIKICWDNSIIIAKIYQFKVTLILYCVGVRCKVDIFKLTASAQSIYREVYDLLHNLWRDVIPDILVNFVKDFK